MLHADHLSSVRFPELNTARSFWFTHQWFAIRDSTLGLQLDTRNGTHRGQYAVDVLLKTPGLYASKALPTHSREFIGSRQGLSQDAGQRRDIPRREYPSVLA